MNQVDYLIAIANFLSAYFSNLNRIRYMRNDVSVGVFTYDSYSCANQYGLYISMVDERSEALTQRFEIEADVRMSVKPGEVVLCRYVNDGKTLVSEHRFVQI